MEYEGKGENKTPKLKKPLEELCDNDTEKFKKKIRKNRHKDEKEVMSITILDILKFWSP